MYDCYMEITWVNLINTKLDTKSFTLYGFIYMRFKNQTKPIHADSNYCPGIVPGKGAWERFIGASRCSVPWSVRSYMCVFKICEFSELHIHNLCIFLLVCYIKKQITLKVLCKPSEHSCKSGRVHGPIACAIYPGSNFWIYQTGILAVHIPLLFLPWAFACILCLSGILSPHCLTIQSFNPVSASLLQWFYYSPE